MKNTLISSTNLKKSLLYPLYAYLLLLTSNTIVGAAYPQKAYGIPVAELGITPEEEIMIAYFPSLEEYLADQALNNNMSLPQYLHTRKSHGSHQVREPLREIPSYAEKYKQEEDAYEKYLQEQQARRAHSYYACTQEESDESYEHEHTAKRAKRDQQGQSIDEAMRAYQEDMNRRANQAYQQFIENMRAAQQAKQERERIRLERERAQQERKQAQERERLRVKQERERARKERERMRIEHERKAQPEHEKEQCWNNDTHYGTLAIPIQPLSTISFGIIRKAYLAASLIYHPDRPTGDTKKFQAIQMAHETLSDDSQRQTYDAQLRKDGFK